MAIPIIIPINNTTTRDCIIQEGTRYCESKSLTKHDVGMVLLSSAFLLGWMLFWIHQGIDEERPILALCCGLFIPLIIGGLLLMFI